MGVLEWIFGEDGFFCAGEWFVGLFLVGLLSADVFVSRLSAF